MRFVSISHWGIFAVGLFDIPVEVRFALLKQHRLMPANYFDDPHNHDYN
jgi:hypothetical protein